MDRKANNGLLTLVLIMLCAQWAGAGTITVLATDTTITGFAEVNNVTKSYNDTGPSTHDFINVTIPNIGEAQVTGSAGAFSASSISFAGPGNANANAHGSASSATTFATDSPDLVFDISVTAIPIRSSAGFSIVDLTSNTVLDSETFLDTGFHTTLHLSLEFLVDPSHEFQFGAGATSAGFETDSGGTVIASVRAGAVPTPASFVGGMGILVLSGLWLLRATPGHQRRKSHPSEHVA